MAIEFISNSLAICPRESLERRSVDSDAMHSDAMHSDAMHSDAMNGEISTVVEATSLRSSVVVGLESSRCLAFKRSADQSKQLRKRSFLIYELEESLPLDGENLAVGQIRSPQGVLCIAADGQTLLPSIRQCEEQGWHVSAISPLIMLAIGTLKRERSLRPYDVVIWKSGETMDLIRLEGGNPMDWCWSGADDSCMLAALVAMGEVDESLSILAINLPESLVSCLSEHAVGEQGEVERFQMERDQAAIAASERIVKGHARPLVDLRNGPLEPTDPLYAISMPLRFFVVAAFLAQLAIAGAVFLRGQQFRKSASELAETQEVFFERLFPGEAVPVGIVSRFESERRRLAGTRGIAGQGIPKLGSVVSVAHKFLSAMPNPSVARYSLDRVELMPGKIQSTTGTAKSYGALEEIAKELRKAGFEVPPVSAVQTSTGVSLRFEEISIIEKGDVQ